MPCTKQRRGLAAAKHQHPHVLLERLTGAAALTWHPPLPAVQGNTLYKEGQFLKAAAAYTQGLKADPTHSVLYRCCRSPMCICVLLAWCRQHFRAF